ncbi:hypothetical protein C8J56DRAFT_1037957 [Mycena floridula]|nr:hypothetical protein C8J56DRAFT_1037957 [Mycena floridula]
MTLSGVAVHIILMLILSSDSSRKHCAQPLPLRPNVQKFDSSFFALAGTYWPVMRRLRLQLAQDIDCSASTFPWSALLLIYLSFAAVSNKIQQHPRRASSGRTALCCSPVFKYVFSNLFGFFLISFCLTVKVPALGYSGQCQKSLILGSLTRLSIPMLATRLTPPARLPNLPLATEPYPPDDLPLLEKDLYTFISALDQIPSLSSTSSISTTAGIPNPRAGVQKLNTTPNLNTTPKPKLGGPHALRANIRTPTRAGVNPDLTKHLQAGRNRLATSQTGLLPPMTGSDRSPRKAKAAAAPNVEFPLPPGLSYGHFTDAQLAAFKALPPDQKLAFYNVLFPDSSAPTRSNITAPPRLPQTATVSPDSNTDSVKAGSSAALSPSEATQLFFAASKQQYRPKSFPEIQPISIDISGLGPRLRETYCHLDNSESAKPDSSIEGGFTGDDNEEVGHNGFEGDNGQEDEFEHDDGDVDNRDGPHLYGDDEGSASHRWSHSPSPPKTHFSDFHLEESVSSHWKSVTPPARESWKPVVPLPATSSDLGQDFGDEFGGEWRVLEDSNRQRSSSSSSRLPQPKNGDSSASHHNPNDSSQERSSSASSLFRDRENGDLSSPHQSPNHISPERSSSTSPLFDDPKNDQSLSYQENPNDNNPERSSSTSSRLARHQNFLSLGSLETFPLESASQSPTFLPTQHQSVARHPPGPLSPSSPSGPHVFKAWDPDMSDIPKAEDLISAAYEAMDATIERLSQLTDKTSLSLIQGYKRHQNQRQGNTWNGFQKMMEDEKEFEDAMELLVGTEHEFTGSVVGEASGIQIRAAYNTFKERNPKHFKVHIDTWVQASKINVTVTRQQRQRNFDKHFKAMTDIAQGSHVTDAYETVIISGGKMINSDAGLADLYVSPGAQNFLERISKMPINKVMAVFKTHVFNNVADAIIAAAHLPAAAAATEAVQVNASEADKALTAEVRSGLISRAALVDLILSKSNFPWKLLLQYMVERGYAFRNYPPLAKPPHLSDGKGLGGTTKMTRQQIALKLNDKDAPLTFVQVPIADNFLHRLHLKSDKVPVLRYATDMDDKRSVYYSHLAQSPEEPKAKNATKATKVMTDQNSPAPMTVRFVPETVDSSGPSQTRASTTSASSASKPKGKTNGTATGKKPPVQVPVVLSDIGEEDEGDADDDFLAPVKSTTKRKRGTGKPDANGSKKQRRGRAPGPSAAVRQTRKTTVQGNRPLTRSRSISITHQTPPPIAGSSSGLYLPEQDHHRRQIDEALNIAKAYRSASSGPEIGGADLGPNFNWSYPCNSQQPDAPQY